MNCVKRDGEWQLSEEVNPGEEYITEDMAVKLSRLREPPPEVVMLMDWRIKNWPRNKPNGVSGPRSGPVVYQVGYCRNGGYYVTGVRS